MQNYVPDVVIYHDKCMDGFTAAWAVWKRYGDYPAFIPCNYGQLPPENLDGKHVLIVDFSFSRAVLEDMVMGGEAASVVILDHHKTAQAELEPFHFRESAPGIIAPEDIPGILRDLAELDRPPIIALFDMERSGAGIAWDFCHERVARPLLVNLVEDRDLWRFALGEWSKHLHLSLSSGPATFDRWDAVKEGTHNFIRQGKAIAAYRDQLVDEIVQRAVTVVIDGQYGIGVDCPYGLASDVGHRLLDDWPDAAFAAAIVRGKRTVTYSLRSRDNRADVSAIAKKFGGGGHRNAAGFKVPRT